MEDSVEVRRQRLEAMRRQRSGGEPEGLGGELLAGPRRTQGPPRGAMVRAVVQRLRAILSQPAPDSPLVPGTAVHEQNVVQLVTLLRQRAADPQGKKGARLAEQALHFLEREDGGPRTVENVSIGQLKKFLFLAARLAGTLDFNRVPPRGEGPPAATPIVGVSQSCTDDLLTPHQTISGLESPDEATSQPTDVGPAS